MCVGLSGFRGYSERESQRWHTTSWINTTNFDLGTNTANGGFPEYISSRREKAERFLDPNPSSCRRWFKR